MEYKSLKCNLLFYLSRIVPSKDFKMLCKQYLKTCDAVPEMAKPAWKCIIANYKFRKKHAGNFKIVSLGWGCMPRTLLTLWMLKASKGVGEKGMPFDLAATPPEAMAHFLENDFADYFEGNWVYKNKNIYNCWFNEAWDNVFFPHEIGLKNSEADLAELQRRMAGRIDNFREAVAFDGPVLFVMHRAALEERMPAEHKAEDVERVCRKIAEIRGDKPFKILIFTCDHNDNCSKIAGAEVVEYRYPHAGYVWHLNERFTPAGVKFEIGFLDICRNALKELCKGSK